MPAASLSIDYAPTSRDDSWQVTVVQRLDINVLRTLVGRLRLRVAATVPDASAPGALAPLLNPQSQGLAWRDESHQLWATQKARGCVTCDEVESLGQLAEQLQVPLRLCADVGGEASSLDVQQAIHRCQPPLPVDGDRYAIALGLALGNEHHGACC